MKNVDICPVCETNTQLENIVEIVPITVRGEEIRVSVNFERCPECDERWENPDEDMMDRAFREYRKRHDMLMPEEIRNLRQRYGLTQVELSRFLGFGAVTLSRYENGALQDEAHDNALRLISNPENMLELVKRHKTYLPPEKVDNLLKSIRQMISAKFSSSILEKLLALSPMNSIEDLHFMDSSNVDKVINSLLFFCIDGIGVTTLNKLMFYMDFKHFKETGRSITGLSYAAINYGPVPNDYSMIYSAIVKDGYLREGRRLKGEYILTEYRSACEPDMSIFSKSEIETMNMVKNHFAGFTAKQIADFSHKEKGYKDTTRGHIIPYTYAESLLL